MSLTNPNTPVSQKDLQDFYHKILPYLGGMPEMLANKFDKSNLYSTDEKIVGQWIDGKPLYQRTINQTLSNTNDWQDLAVLGTTCEVVSLLGLVCKTDGQRIIFGSSFAGQLNITVNYPAVGTISISTALRGYVLAVVQYTKTTDSAISIGSDTDYSTKEKIIGTWIDGKLLYQRTYTYNEPVVIDATTWTTFNDISATDIENLISCNGITTGGSCWAFGGSCDSTYVGIYNYRNTGLSVIALTIQYTKTTD